MTIEKHKLNVIGALLATALFLFSAWQIDLIGADYVWKDLKPIEVLPGWIMRNGDAWVMWFTLLFIGFVLFGLSLWFWEDE